MSLSMQLAIFFVTWGLCGSIMYTILSYIITEDRDLSFYVCVGSGSFLVGLLPASMLHSYLTKFGYF